MLLKTTVQAALDARNSTFNNVEGHQTNNYTYNIFIGCHAASFIVGVLFFWFVHSKYVFIFAALFPSTSALTDSSASVIARSFQLERIIMYY